MNWVNLQRDYRFLFLFVHIFISFLHICRYNGKTSTLLCFFLARVELCCFFQILVRFNMDGCSVRFDACAPPWLFLYTHTHTPHMIGETWKFSNLRVLVRFEFMAAGCFLWSWRMLFLTGMTTFRKKSAFFFRWKRWLSSCFKSWPALSIAAPMG